MGLESVHVFNIFVVYYARYFASRRNQKETLKLLDPLFLEEINCNPQKI